ncbi:hypothetical protein E4J89_15075 [Arthrobacter sp. CAU 1506]|uniref:hypothetical protein n=1 Tax=Arthrobacter sp. CAU 1506 TaxID=2560052 RepID=UPI0010AC5A49|nr:hypothetical protein [Arthrobacter sp. CAU 1506]TJY67407.1 hypothetical protein E4J89_15075 [Arthrobacter sp. CAU 1506]
MSGESMPQGLSLTWKFLSPPTAANVAKALRQVARHPLPSDLSASTLVVMPQPDATGTGFRIDLFIPLGSDEETGDA